MRILQTIDLKKYYGTEPNITRALDGVNFSVNDGEFVAVVGPSGSGKSTLMEQIRRPVLAHADRVQDTVVIFAAKPDVLRCRRPGDPVISVSATDPASCWNLFRELDASDTPELTLREIASALFAEQKKKTTQIFFPEAAQEIFYQTARFMRDFGRTNNIPVSNAELSEFLTRTTVFAQEGAGTGTNGSWQELVERYPTYFSAARDLIGDGGAQGLGVLSEVRTMLSRLFIGSFNRRPVLGPAGHPSGRQAGVYPL